MLTTFDLDQYVYAALAAGAGGFLLKDVTSDHLAAAIRLVGTGDALLAPSITRRLVERYAGSDPGAAAAPGSVLGPGSAAPRPRAAASARVHRDLAGLTPREHEVLTLMGRGLSNAELARALTLSEATVKTHVARIFAKLNLRERAQAVVLAYETGLVSPGDGDSSVSRRPTRPASWAIAVPPHSSRPRSREPRASRSNRRQRAGLRTITFGSTSTWWPSSSHTIIRWATPSTHRTEISRSVRTVRRVNSPRELSRPGAAETRGGSSTTNSRKARPVQARPRTTVSRPNPASTTRSRASKSAATPIAVRRSPRQWASYTTGSGGSSASSGPGTSQPRSMDMDARSSQRTGPVILTAR